MKFSLKLKEKANVIIFDKKILSYDKEISKFYFDRNKLYLNILFKSLKLLMNLTVPFCLNMMNDGAAHCTEEVEIIIINHQKKLNFLNL